MLLTAVSTRIHVTPLPVFLGTTTGGISFGKIIKAQPDVGEDNASGFSREPVPPIFVVLFVVILIQGEGYFSSREWIRV